jgi:D-ribulokinase
MGRVSAWRVHISGMETYLGIDLGTGGVRILAVNAQGDVLARSAQKLDRINTAFTDGHSEQHPGEWIEALDSALDRIFCDLRSPIAAIAVTSTSGTVLPTDEAGWPLAPAIMHNDVRAREEAAELAMSPTFSLPKIRWMQRHLKLAEGAQFLHATDFINAYLCGPCPTDFTNAMKTGVDLETLDWPPDLPARERLPAVVGPGSRIGQLRAAHCQRWSISKAPIICAGATDSNAGFYASGASRVGDWSTTIGTTLAVKGICEVRIDDLAGRIYCHRHPDLAWLPGGACNAGGEILRKHFPDADFADLDRQALARGPSDHLVYPLARRGERLPIVNPDAVGFVEGDLADRTGLYGGCLQGVAFTERWIYELLAELGADTSGCVATTGGGARSDYWLQLRADILKREVIVPAEPECAFGAAILAAAGHRDEAVAESASRMVTIAKRFHARTDVDWDSRYRAFRALCAAKL